MPRLLFEKTGNAVWMSHLDLMRVFQRAFKRAGLHLKHSQGYNPRPFVSIALPLSVGVESCCELLDCELEGEQVSCDDITERLNKALVDGVRVRQTYEDGRKIKYLSLLRCNIRLEYDSGVPQGAMEELQGLFKRECVCVTKKSKNGIVEQDIIPMIRNMQICKEDEHTVVLDALICCQNPTLNPAQIVAAIGKYLPECAPDFAKYCRTEVFDENENVFR